jgi:acetoin utilization protein AcuB
MRVRELMNRNLVTISDDGALVGVVTDRDLRHYLFRPHVRKDIGATSVEVVLKAVTVDEIMSAPVITVDAADDVTDAARMMLEDRVGSLPVTEGGRLVGIITETDLLREICRADPACSPEVTDIVVSHR